VAVAESDINGQVYFYGEIDNTEAAMGSLLGNSNQNTKSCISVTKLVLAGTASSA
jgi:hypothetical protein